MRRFDRTLSISAVTISLACVAVAVLACAKPEGETPKQKRSSIQNANRSILDDVYSKQPEARRLVGNSYGYATFTNIETKLGLFGSGNGYGLATHRGSGKQTYMKMRKVHVGFGGGVQEFDLLMIFKSKANFDQFLESGWQFGAGADAAAKTRQEGGVETGVQAAIDENLDPIVFQVTQAGVSVGATAEGFKFSVDDELN